MSAQFTEKEKHLLSFFKDVIEREQGAQVPHSRMAEDCQDPGLRKIVKEIRRDEKRYENALLVRYKALMKITECSG